MTVCFVLYGKIENKQVTLRHKVVYLVEWRLIVIQGSNFRRIYNSEYIPFNYSHSLGSWQQWGMQNDCVLNFGFVCFGCTGYFYTSGSTAPSYLQQWPYLFRFVYLYFFFRLILCLHVSVARNSSISLYIYAYLLIMLQNDQPNCMLEFDDVQIYALFLGNSLYRDMSF